MRLALFVEDAGQHDFVVGLVNRIAADEGVEPELVVRNSVGGSSGVLSSLRSYLRDVARGRDSFAEVVVAVVDGNCSGHTAKVQSIRDAAGTAGYAGLLVCAVPDPHIEAWYLADGGAIGRVLRTRSRAQLPARKCERDFYKERLINVFEEANIHPPLGGAEYGSEIAAALDLVVACRQSPSLNAFVQDLRGAIRQLGR